MIDNRLKKCCEECVNRSTYADDTKLYSSDTVVSVATIIRCEYDAVCAKYVLDNVENARQFDVDTVRKSMNDYYVLYKGTTIEPLRLEVRLLDIISHNSQVWLEGLLIRSIHRRF